MNLVIIPALMPELERGRGALREHLEKRRETLAILLKIRRELEEHDAQPFAQCLDGGK